jgi:hypothetical protein
MALRRRRPHVEDHPALIGATAQVNMGNASSWKTWKFGNQAWQVEAWRLYDLIPEERFLANWIGDSVAQARLYVTEVDERGEEQGEVKDERISRLAAVPLGTGAARDENLRLAGVDLAVGGECWIVGEGAAATDPDGPTEEGAWFVVTGNAFKTEAGTVKVKRPMTKGGEWLALRDGTDITTRCWRAHPNDVDQADSPTRAALVPLREIELLTKREFAELDSRLTGAGFWFLPEGVDFPRAPGDATGLAGFMQYAQRTAARSMQNQDDASAMVPIMATLPDSLWESGAASSIKDGLVNFWSELSDKITEMKDKAIGRVAYSFEIPNETLLGMSTANHWTAWAISEEGIKRIKSYLKYIADALTRGFLRPALIRMGVANPERYAFAFDTAPLAVRPNRTEDALQLHARHLISDVEAVKAAAFDEDQMPTPEERVLQMLVAIVPNHPELLLNPGVQAMLGFPLIETVGGSTPVGQPEEDEEDEADQAPNDGNAEGPSDNEADTEAAAISAGLNARIRAHQAAQAVAAAVPSRQAVFNAAGKLIVLRALELAGGRLTTPAERRGRWADVPRHELHVRVGPITPDQADKKMEGAFTHVPVVAADLGVDPAELERLLAGYCRELLTRGMAHHDDMLYAALGMANRGAGLLDAEPAQPELVAA